LCIRPILFFKLPQDHIYRTFIERHNAITNVYTHRHNQPLWVGNGCVQNESSSKEWTIT